MGSSTAKCIADALHSNTIVELTKYQESNEKIVQMSSCRRNTHRMCFRIFLIHESNQKKLCVFPLIFQSFFLQNLY